MALLQRLPDRPVPIAWKTAGEAAGSNAMEAMREWTVFFRDSYREAEAAARRVDPRQRKVPRCNSTGIGLGSPSL